MTAAALLCALVGALAFSAAPALSFAGHPYESRITEAQIASSPPPATNSFRPWALAVDNSPSSPSSGDVYVIDSTHRAVDKFTSAGVYQSQLTGTPSGPFGGQEGGLYGGLAVDSNGNLYVADSGNNVVYKFDATGTLVPGSGGPSSPFVGTTPSGPFGGVRAVAVDASGNIYVVDGGEKVIDKFNSSGEFIPGSAGPSSPLISGTPSGPMMSPKAVAVDSTGNIYVVDGGEKVIDKFNSSGEFIPGSAGPSSPFLTVPGYPYSVGIDNSTNPADPGTGDIYVPVFSGYESNIPSALYAFDSSGNRLLTLVGSDTPKGSFAYLTSVAVDSEGRLYVGDGGEGVVRPGVEEHHEVDIFGSVVEPDLAITTPTNIQPTSATLNGTVNPDAIQVSSCQFDYVEAALYRPFAANPYASGHTATCAQTPAQIGAGNSPVPVSADISGLAPDTTYHFRLDAGNANGIHLGDDREFTTYGPPTVDGESTEGIGKTAATLLAQINPHGFSTTYHFEYDTAEYREGEGPHGTSLPIPDAGAGSGANDVQASAEATGLQAGITYHFRVVATNSAGPPVYGPDETFRTVPALRISAVFAGEIETGSATLSAAIDPLGTGTTYHFEYGTDSSYGTSVPVPDQSAGSGSGNQVVTAHLTGLQAGATYHFRVVAQNSLGAVSSPDASFGTEPGSCPNEGLRTGLSGNLPDCRAYEMVSPPYKADYGVKEGSLGIAPDGERAVFTSVGAFAGAKSDVFEAAYVARRDPANGWVTAATSPPPLDGRTPALSNDYTPALTKALTVMVSSELGVANRTALVSSDLLAPEVSFAQEWPLPDGNAVIPGPTNTMVATSADLSHAVFGQAVGVVHVGLEEIVGIGGTEPKVLPIGGTDFSAHLSRGSHPINADGSEIFFDDSSLRVNDSTTLALPGDFEGASADGSTVFLIDANGVLSTAKIDREPGHEAVGETVAITPGASASVIHTSDDGSHVYFTSPGVFAGPNAQGQAPEAGASNLYVYDTLTREVKFIAVTEVSKSSSGDYEAQITPDGRYLVFATRSQLTGDDTDTAVDVYRYDAGTGALARVSMGEAGADSNGNNSAFDANVSAPPPPYASGALAQWRLGTRAISDDGSTIVFSTSEPLSPRVVSSGTTDVYAWHEGRVGMISTGRSLTSDRYPVVSATGRDIFFLSKQSISPQDSDGLFDVYDARIGGGFPPPPPPPPSCEGNESCHGEGVNEPPQPILGSGSLSHGPEEPEKPKCKKGSTLKHGRCVKRNPRRRCKPGKRRNRHGQCVKLKKGPARSASQRKGRG